MRERAKTAMLLPRRRTSGLMEYFSKRFRDQLYEMYLNTLYGVIFKDVSKRFII